MKEIRFSELVKTAGHPKTEALWSDPKSNKSFMQATRGNRVLTVVQKPHGKDFGEIGFHEQPRASYLVFPKSLPRSDARVIGLKYDLIEEPPVKDPARPVKPPKGIRPPPAERKPRQVEPAEFEVTIRRTAVVEKRIRVSARNPSDAKARALQSLKEQLVDVSQAEVQDKILAVRKT